ncbi:MAG: penicillin-binding protein 2 [Epsilonproteobacteria bacterium]|nr:penicillin-binding protein 2 [Campylobacterota bacterium]
MKRRIKLIVILFSLFWILIISRLYFLSIKSNQYYQELAKRNMVNTEYLLPTRGEIKDTKGNIIAMSKLGFSISLKAHLSAKSKANILKKNLQLIADTFPNIHVEKLYKRYKRYDTPYNHRAITLVDFVPYDEMIEKFITFSQYNDITIKPTAKRYYPYQNTASHIIGYVAKANQKEIENNPIAKHLGVVGKNGIEKQYESILGGSIGKREVKVTASNREIGLINEEKPKSEDITLTIDMQLQDYIKKIFGDRTGALIVMDVTNGAVLAAGSFPEYNINSFVQGISNEEWQKMITNLDHPFTNKFIQGLYPPGSSTKTAVGLSFLNSGKLDEKEEFLCSGELRLGKRKFRCWNSYGHGAVDLRRAISESCDDYFYKGGLRVGIDKISTDLARYGFGKKTGIDLPNEFIGTVPNRNWKINKFGESWYKGETLNTVIGQGDFLATPMQVASFTAMVATGQQITPHFVQKIADKNITYQTLDHIFNAKEQSTLPLIRDAMYDVCYAKRGTAFKYNTSMVTIAGKTGTSQVVGIPQEEKERMSEDDLKYYQKSHAWFTTYGPFESPKYVVTALIEHGGHGGEAAGGLISDIYNKLVDLGYIDTKFVRPEYEYLLIPDQSISDTNTTSIEVNQTTL